MQQLSLTIACCKGQLETFLKAQGREQEGKSLDITTLGGDQPQAGVVKPLQLMSIPTAICSQLGVTTVCQHS